MIFIYYFSEFHSSRLGKYVCGTQCYVCPSYQTQNPRGHSQKLRIDGGWKNQIDDLNSKAKGCWKRGGNWKVIKTPTNFRDFISNCPFFSQHDSDYFTNWYRYWNSALVLHKDNIHSMRILERVQPFFTSFEFWDFFGFYLIKLGGKNQKKISIFEWGTKWLYSF